LCGRCLRGMDTRTHDELSIMLDQEEYDDISMAESLISENQRDSELTVQVFLLFFLTLRTTVYQSAFARIESLLLFEFVVTMSLLLISYACLE